MNFLRKAISLPTIRRQFERRMPLRKLKKDAKRNPGFLQWTLGRLKATIKPEDEEEKKELHPILLDNHTFFRKLDEPLRFIFKLPFIQNFYLLWLQKEDVSLSDSINDKLYFLFLGELVFYGKLGIETFEKLIMINFPEITKFPDFPENLIITHHLMTRNKSFIEESLYQLERGKKVNIEEDEHREVPYPLSTRNYFKYIDLSVRPLFKFEVVQTLFGRWLKLEGVNINDCFEAHYHNLFLEELLYYYDQGEGFIRSIIKNIYTDAQNKKLTEEELNTLYLLVQSFDTILDEAVKRIKESQGDLKEMDRKTFLNHGYDFGMILYYVANKDAFNALMTARGLVIDTASKIWEKKQVKKSEEKKKSD